MFDYFRKISAAAGDTPDMHLRKFTLLIITLCCCIAAPIWSYSYYLIGLHISALIPIAYMMVVSPFIVLFIITKKEKLLFNVQLVAIFLCPVIMQWLAGGFM